MNKASFLRHQYRRIRLLAKSFIFLPPFVRVIVDNKEARLSTRGFPTANTVFWLNTRDVLDYEPEARALLEPFLKKARSFWDIGAQIGFYSILAALAGVQKILAVDIDERYCEEIKKHARKNKLSINVVCAATGQEGQEVSFENYANYTTRKAVSFDKLAELYGYPDVVKLDVDGGELNTILGGNKVFSRSNAPVLMIELDPSFSDVKKIKGILQGYGYNFFDSRGVNTLWAKRRICTETLN